ncbi:MAG: phosphoribosylamine--glycine ligase, partial [Candidatus Binatia bacterium]
MKVLVIGSGGREHALVWKIHQSPRVDKIFCAPGSAAIAELAECV